ncbi:MAG: family 43 glycosylhydrolase [Phycisphaerae bacterium]|nr:family 43 glycosylhydrolase [Phycisphaerae bacterium]
MLRVMKVAAAVTMVLSSWSLLAAQKSGDPEVMTAVKADFEDRDFTFQEVANLEDRAGIGQQRGITRRDPSDIIQVGDTYFVYYTYVDQNALPPNLRPLRASGYVGTIRYATSRDEGFHWIERGQALGRGTPGSFDSFAVFTPNILKWDNRYWLYYTGVKATPGREVFENNSVNDFTAIGVAVADSPHGPFVRLSDQPILTVTPKSNDPARPSPFDSYRIDDAALLVRDFDKDGDPDVWLYYKGRNIDHGRSGPAKTQMGLAIAETPAGPYMRINRGKPILPNSHEVMIWPHRQGVAAYASASRTFEFAPDGMDFMSRPLGVRTATRPTAPGCFRMDLTDSGASGPGISWGISMRDPGGPFPYLVRYEISAPQ